MTDLVLVNTALTMTSLEIAELVESRHDKVKQSIERLAKRGIIELPPLGEIKTATKPLLVYQVDKRSSYIVVAQLSPEFTARLVDRWQELERNLQKSVLPQDYPTALRMLANEVEQRQLAIAQRDEALRTKAYISDKKTATAMATASVAVRHAKRLEDELGRGAKWKSAKSIPWVKDYLSPSKGMWGQLGKKLKAISDEMGIEAVKIESDEYGQVNAYHVDVIEKLRCRLEADDNMLGKYRNC